MLDNIMPFYRKLNSIKEGHLLYALYDTEARETKEKLENFLKIFFETKDEPGFRYIASFKEFMNVVTQYQSKIEFIINPDPSAKPFLDEIIKIIQSGNLQNAVKLLTTLKQSCVNVNSQTFFQNLKNTITPNPSEGNDKKRKYNSNSENGAQISGYAGSTEGHWFSSQIPQAMTYVPVISTEKTIQQTRQQLRPESMILLDDFYVNVLNKLNNGELIDISVRTNNDPLVNKQVTILSRDTSQLEGLKKSVYTTIHTYLTYLLDKKENFISRTKSGHSSLKLLLLDLFIQYPALKNVLLGAS